MQEKIEGELLEKLKAHLIHKLREKSSELDDNRWIDCQDAEDIISQFDGVPTPPENPPGSGTK